MKNGTILIVKSKILENRSDNMESWIFPTNIKHYDIVKHFKRNNKIVWKYNCSLNKGDFVYLYVGSPYSQILYKCKVLDIELNGSVLQENKYAITLNATHKTKYAMLLLEKEYNKDTAPKFNELKEKGLGQVQKQARVNRKLLKFLEGLN